jgi:two-component system, cell cycle sensor histidine kinase and response regulator CckA
MEGADPQELREIVTNMLEGFALHEIVLDVAGAPVDYRFLDVNPAFEQIMGLSRAATIGRTAREIFPAMHQDWITRYGRVALGQGPVHFTDRSPDLERWFEVRAFSPRPGCFACTFTDVTERLAVEEATRRNEALLQSLVAVSQRQSHDVQDLLEFALEEAIRLTVSRFGYLYLYDEEHERFQLTTWSRDVMRECRIRDPKSTYSLDRTGLWGEAVRQRRPLVVNDFASPSSLKRGMPEGHVQFARFMSIPVFSGSRIVAVLGVADKPDAYRDVDVRQVQLLMEPVWRIVERTRAEDAIRGARQRMESILEATGTGMDIVDAQHRVLFVNEGWQRVYGPPAGRTCHEYYFGRTTPCVPCNSRQALETRARVVSEMHLPLHNRHYQVTAIPFQTDEGEWQVSEIMVDISEHRSAEEELRSTRELLQNLMERAPVAIHVTAADGRLRMVNRQWEKDTGVNRLDALGSPSSGVLPADDARRHEEACATVTGTDRPQSAEETITTPGGLRHVHAVRFPLHDAWGNVEAVGGFALDISESKAAAAERLRLEQKVLHAQKLESLGVLAGGIAHDFNNLLMAVMGNIDMALEDLPLGSGTRASVEEAMSAARRAAGLTSQLLAYSGKGGFVVRAIDLSETVGAMAGLLRASIPRSVILERRLAERLPLIEADIPQIHQVIMNLLINAAEAIGPAAEGTIVLETGAAAFDEATLSRSMVPHRLPAGRCVYLRVRDTGGGMTPETLARIFDPFFSTKSAGRGLGLAAVLGIVRARGGAIMVESSPGAGAEFTLLFPPAAAAARAGAEAPAEAALQWQGSGTVLIADDDEAVLPLAARMVERLGCRPLCAADGRAAVDLFRENASAVQCVILDLTMPRLGGLEACDQILACRPGTPVILSSGYSEIEMKTRFGGREIAGFLQKPYRFSDLSQLLQSALHARGAA